MHTAVYSAVGYMPMPEDFPFKALFYHGRPQHKPDDLFRIRHPKMDHTHRAKLFAPFDALAGFDDAIASKEVLYEPKRLLTDTEKENLDARLQQLRSLTRSGPATRKNRPQAAITYFVPCADKNSFAYGFEGTYNTVSGTVERADLHEIVIDGQRIPLDDVCAVC